jgi:hypothetical protein
LPTTYEIKVLMKKNIEEHGTQMQEGLMKKMI